VVGSQIGYWVGRFGGRPFVVRWGRYVFITSERLGQAEAFFARHGGSAVFLARFVVGLRVFGALVAGTSRMPWGKFALYSLLGGIVWAAAAVSLGYFLWASISLVEHWVGRVSLLLVAALALALLLRWTYRRATHRGGSGGGPPGFHVVWQRWIFAWAELFGLACLPGQSRIATWSKRRIQLP
jgi:undecaprenyl-diphosphatase